jgi:hypothetical protein
MSVKMFNSLADYLTNLVHDKKQFIGKMKDILSHNPSLCQDLQLRKRNV